MIVDDHMYCLLCRLHSRACWCYMYSSPEEDNEEDTACSGGEGHN